MAINEEGGGIGNVLKKHDASHNWASEASPTLGCSIEISGDIYMYVGMSVVSQINCVGGITWTKHAHAQSQVLGC